MVLCSLCLYGDPRWHGLPKEFWNPHSTYQKKQFEKKQLEKTDDKPEVAFEKIFCCSAWMWFYGLLKPGGGIALVPIKPQGLP